MRSPIMNGCDLMETKNDIQLQINGLRVLQRRLAPSLKSLQETANEHKNIRMEEAFSQSKIPNASSIKAEYDLGKINKAEYFKKLKHINKVNYVTSMEKTPEECANEMLQNFYTHITLEIEKLEDLIGRSHNNADQ